MTLEDSGISDTTSVQFQVVSIQESSLTNIAHVDSSVEVGTTMSLQVGCTGKCLTTCVVLADVWSVGGMNSSVLKQKKAGREFPPTTPALPQQSHLYRSHDCIHLTINRFQTTLQQSTAAILRLHDVPQLSLLEPHLTNFLCT